MTEWQAFTEGNVAQKYDSEEELQFRVQAWLTRGRARRLAREVFVSQDTNLHAPDVEAAS